MSTTSARKCPVTKIRRPAVAAGTYIDEPGIPRASCAVSSEATLGSGNYSAEFSDYSVLQQHVLFWDRDSDGIIWPSDTFAGFRDLGFNLLFSMLAVGIVHSGFSYPTRLGHSWIPDPFFRLYMDGIHKAKHGSDSTVFDNEGRFVPQSFENLFSKYGRDKEEFLSLSDVFSLMRGQRCAADPFGWWAALFEWGTTWLLVQKDGRISKEDLRQVYDGSMFFRVKAARSEKEGWNQGYGFLGDNFWGHKKLDFLVQAEMKARSFPGMKQVARLLNYRGLLLLLFAATFFLMPKLSRRPATHWNRLESAWIGRACPPLSNPVLQPRSTEEVAHIVRDSLTRCPQLLGGGGLSIRASKQLYHSGADFVCANPEAGSCAVQLDMSEMNQLIGVDSHSHVVTVQPGMHLDELMEKLHDHDLALPSDYIPIYTGLSVGGFLLGGGHGSSTMKPSAFGHLCSRVTYVDGMGQIRSDQNATNWIASLGLLGIVTEIELSVVPDYKLNTTVSLENDRDLDVRIAQLIREPDFSRIMWYPNAHSAILRWHKSAPVDTPGDAYHSFFEHRAWAAVGGQIALALDQINFTPIPTDWGICLFAKRPPPFWYKDGKYGTWLSFNQSIVGWPHRLGGSSCRDNQWGCYWRNQFQLLVEFDMDVAMLSDWISEVRTITDMISAKGCLPSLLGFAMRFGKASTAPLDTAYGRDTVYIDMLIAKGIESLPAHHQSALDEIEQMTFCKYGARPHWGKNSPRVFLSTDCPIRPKYPQFDSFMQIATANDPRAIFRPTTFQNVIDGGKYSLQPGCLTTGDCYCKEPQHCGPSALYDCVKGRLNDNITVCAQRFGRE